MVGRGRFASPSYLELLTTAVAEGRRMRTRNSPHHQSIAKKRSAPQGPYWSAVVSDGGSVDGECPTLTSGVPYHGVGLLCQGAWHGGGSVVDEGWWLQLAHARGCHVSVVSVCAAPWRY